MGGIEARSERLMAFVELELFNPEEPPMPVADAVMPGLFFRWGRTSDATAILCPAVRLMIDHERAAAKPAGFDLKDWMIDWRAHLGLRNPPFPNLDRNTFFVPILLRRTPTTKNGE
ncbi:MAG: hypothetical protein AAF360_02765 [Pseudomonadota bacterium]